MFLARIALAMSADSSSIAYLEFNIEIHNKSYFQ